MSEHEPGPHATGPVAIVMSRFPVVTETFILRELDELERQGVPVVLVPLLREHPAAVHAQAAPWVERALYTPFADASIARDVLRSLARRPVRTTGLLVRALAGAASSWNALQGALGIFPKSLSLARRLREEGVRHVHAHFATHPGLAAMLMARSCESGREIPFSMTAHAHDIFVTQAGLEAKVAAASFVRCISAFNARFLNEMFGDAVAPLSKLPVIHCGIEPHKYESEPAAGIPGRDRPLSALCVAALKPYKGVRHLVDAVRLAREGGLDIACRIIGTGPLRDELAARIRTAGLESCIELAGARTQDEVTQELRRSDVFVLPSIVADDGQMEGIPVALMEALAARVPVVATRLSGIPELVRGGETGRLVEPEDAPGLARALRATADEPAAARGMAARGRALVEAEFDLREVTAALATQFDAHGARIDDLDVTSLARTAARICGRDGARRIGVARLSRGSDSLVGDLLVPRPHGAPLRVIAKRHLEREGASAPAAARAAREHAALMALLGEGLSVPRPLGIDRESATLVMERAPGAGAQDAFRRARHDNTAAVAIAGAAWFWLKQLREAEGPPRDEAAFAPDAVLTRLRRELRDDTAACIERGLPSRLVRHVAARCHRELRDAVPHQTCWTHGDFWPGNVLAVVHEGWDVARITVIDLEGLQPGLVLEDAANFLEHVALALPSVLSVSRFDRAREEIESVMIAGSGSGAVIPQALRAVKALRLAARSEALVTGSRARRRLAALRFSARLLEVRP